MTSPGKRLQAAIDRQRRTLKPCEHCGCKTRNGHRRQNTKFHDDSRNYLRLCDFCWDLNEEYWADMWSEYWSMVL